MEYTVVVTFGALISQGERYIPTDLNMGFAAEDSWNAISYYVDSVRYFEDAVKWDPTYYGLGVIATLWHGNRVLNKQRIS